jgi:hypothetical protein
MRLEMLTEFKTAHRSNEWKEGFAQYHNGGNNPKENNPYPVGSRKYSEFQQGYLSAYLEYEHEWAERNGYH